MSDGAAAWDGDPESAALQALLRDVAPALCRDRRVLRATAARVQPARGTPLAAVAAALLDDYFAHASCTAPVPAAAADRGLAEARGRQAALYAAHRAHTPPVGTQQAQLAAARRRAHARWATTAPERPRTARVCTLAQLDARDQAAAVTEAENNSNSSSSTTGEKRGGLLHTIASFSEPASIGRRALELTNALRAQSGLGALRWSEALCAIGAAHSRAMAEGRVPFGHDGFRARVAQMPGGVRAAAENVAMNHGAGDVARTAVRGWSESPGHRRNMLGTYTECGIGVHAHHGRFYLTQLFALR